jgi:hypothetical protein
MKITCIAACVFALAGGWMHALAAENAATPAGEPILGPPTLHSLGVHWVIAGDANHDAEIGLAWRTANGEWRVGVPLRRVESGARKDAKGGGSVQVPEGAQLFAGSVLLLAPETDYELKLTLADADGGNHESLLKARTIGEPTLRGTRQFFTSCRAMAAAMAPRTIRFAASNPRRRTLRRAQSFCSMPERIQRRLTSARAAKQDDRSSGVRRVMARRSSKVAGARLGS